MKEALKMALVYVGLVVMLQLVFIGYKGDGVKDTIVGKIMNKEDYEIISGGETLCGEEERFDWSEEEIFSCEFMAVSQMGLKRKSQVLGQYYDYLRLTDHDAVVKVNINQKTKEAINNNKLYIINIKVKIPYQRLKLNEENTNINMQNKENSYCLFYSKEIEEKDILNKNEYLRIKFKTQPVTIRIDQRVYDINSEFYMDFHSNTSEFNTNKCEDLVLKLSISDPPISNEKYSASEIIISTNSTSNTLSSSLFFAFLLLL